MSTSWGLGLVLGPALGGYLSQVPMETKVAKTIHRSFLESCKIVKLIFFWVGSFAACHEISKSFCGRIPFCTVRCGKGCKDFRCILVSWFIFHYFECDYIHMLKLACGGEWWMLFWWVCEWQVSLPLAIIVQHCTCHCTSLHRFSTPCMCSSKLPWIFASIML